MKQEEIKEQTGFFDRFKEALSFYGLVYIVFLVIIVSMGAMYVSKLSYMTSSKTKMPSLVNDTAKVFGDIPMKKGSITPPVDVLKYITSTPELTSKGQELFKTNCASCHGDNGEGNGPAGAMLNPKPRNFHVLTGWTNGPTIDNMYKTLHEGILTRGMASYNNLPPEDRFALIYYIRGLAVYPPVTDVELKKIDEMYKLSQGVKEPNQIPVKLAMEKLISEYGSKQQRIDKLAEAFKSNQQDSGAVIFKRITSDVNKALTVLAGNPRWNENENEFVNFIITNSTQKGFKGEAADLTRAEASRVYNYLKNLFAQSQI